MFAVLNLSQIRYELDVFHIFSDVFANFPRDSVSNHSIQELIYGPVAYQACQFSKTTGQEFKYTNHSSSSIKCVHQIGSVPDITVDFVGKQLDGVWHTGIVVYDQEFFFGGNGIDSCAPVSIKWNHSLFRHSCKKHL